MIIDIGGGTTEIVIALAGIVCGKSVKIAGDVFTEDIVFYIRTQHNLSIGDRTAEKIKISIGSALDELENPPENLLVQEEIFCQENQKKFQLVVVKCQKL